MNKLVLLALTILVVGGIYAEIPPMLEKGFYLHSNKHYSKSLKIFKKDFHENENPLSLFMVGLIMWEHEKDDLAYKIFSRVNHSELRNTGMRLLAKGERLSPVPIIPSNLGEI